MTAAFAKMERNEPALRRDALHSHLIENTVCADPNFGFIAQMLSSWLTGYGALPAFMGLAPDTFEALCAMFTGSEIVPATKTTLEDEYGEFDDIAGFLTGHRGKRFASEDWITQIIAAGCFGADHLWSDLGLFSRAELTAMMETNFPAFAARNTMNMKWKKFIYRQHCEATGCYICRAPNCQQCADYENCFILPGASDA